MLPLLDYYSGGSEPLFISGATSTELFNVLTIADVVSLSTSLTARSVAEIARLYVEPASRSSGRAVRITPSRAPIVNRPSVSPPVILYSTSLFTPKRRIILG